MSAFALLPSAADPTPPVGRTLAAKVFRQMRADILECRLQPGSKLRFDELRARYLVAVSPLREALTRLSEEGLVTLEEHRGFKVSPVTRQKLLEIISTRREVDALTVRLSMERGDAAWEARVRASFAALATGPIDTDDGEMDTEWERSHAAFHAALHAGAGSMWLERLCALLFDQTTRYRRLWFKHLRGDFDVVGEHREIMDAVLARDVLAATYLMRRHTELLVNPLLDLVPSANE